MLRDLRTTLKAGTDQSPVWTGLLAERRSIALLFGVILLSVALRLVTWNVIADGGQTRYVKTVLFGGFAAAAVWGLVRVQTGPSSRIPLLAAAAVLLSGDAIHYARFANPITRGGPVVRFESAFPSEAAVRRQWEFESAGGGKISIEAGAVRLESPPNATAYIAARLGNLPDVRRQWWLPVGLAERDRAERLSWRASVTRTGPYYVMTELRQLLVQIVSYGVHVTYPDERGDARGHEIQHPVGSDGAVHEWLITRDSKQVVLSIDGKQIWSAPQRGEFNQMKLGETRVDPQHGGSMRVSVVSYVSTLDVR